MQITQKYDLIMSKSNIKVDLNNNHIADKNEPDFYLNISGPQGEKDEFWSDFIKLQMQQSGKANLPNELLKKAGAIGEREEDGGYGNITSLEKAFTKNDEKFVSASGVLKVKPDNNGNLGMLEIVTE